MATIIGGVTLDNDLYWEDEFASPSGIGRAIRAIDGSLFVQHAPIVGGRLFTLQGDINRGWQTIVTVRALKALEAASVGQSISVSFRGVTYVCTFRYEEDQPVAFTPISPVYNPPDTMWYTGVVKLRII